MSTQLVATGQTTLTRQGDKPALCHLAERWLKHEQRMNDATDNTLTTYRRGLEVFAGWLAGNGLTLADVTPGDVLDFKAALAERYKAQTVNLRLTAVRSFYRFAVNAGRMPLNPASEVKGVKRSRSKSHKRDVLANGEVLAVLNTCDPDTLAGARDRAILALMAYGGARQIEVHRANVGDLRTRDDRLVLYVTGKGHAEADEFIVIPLSQEPVIRSWLSLRSQLRRVGTGPNSPLFISLSNQTYGGRLSLRAIRHMVKERFEAAGVADPGNTKTTHSLRHSAITNAIRQGGTPLQVQAMARHSSFDTTLNYYHEVGRLDNPAEDLICYS